MAASAPLRLLFLSPSSSPRPPRDPSLRPVPPLHAWLPRRRQLRVVRCASSSLPPPSLDLPLLPFQPAEVRSLDRIVVSLFFFGPNPILSPLNAHDAVSYAASEWPIERNLFGSWKINFASDSVRILGLVFQWYWKAGLCYFVNIYEPLNKPRFLLMEKIAVFN